MKFFKILFFLSLFSLILSCQETINKSFTIKGTINGLTKGTVYLEKVQDTLIVKIDSFSVRDDGKFIVGDHIDSPEIYYLGIKEVPTEKLLIFGEKGIVNMTSKLEKFVFSAKVNGSINHDLLKEYKAMNQKFQDLKLNIFKANLEAEQRKDSLALDSLELKFKNLRRRRYLYTTNFAVNNANKDIAPYLALTELYNANISLLDTINNSLSEEIKNSKYGKQLDQFITVINKNNSKNLLQ